MNNQNTNLSELFFKVNASLHRLLSHQFQTMGPMGNPHRGQGRVLSLLKLQPEISQKELGYLLDMRNQSLSELLSKLEKNGFITRTPSETDRRTTNIKLTETGADAAGKVGDKQDDIESVFDCFDEDEQVKLCDYLKRLSASLEKQLGDLGISGEQRFGEFRGHARGMGGMHHPHHGRSPHHFHERCHRFDERR